MIRRRLIFDIGFHTGQDTAFYLKKGFWVVGVDANPALVAEGKAKFSDAITAGRLVLLNCGIGDQRGKLPFFVNLENSAFSSFDPDIGTARGKFEVLDVELTPLADLVRKYGVPHYVKIDIEGYDYDAIKSLAEIGEKPDFISIENGQAHMIEELARQGYKRFKWVNQAMAASWRLPRPALEGEYVDYSFEFGSSGPFGEEAPGSWLRVDEVMALSAEYWGNPSRDANIHGWFDLHAAR